MTVVREDGTEDVLDFREPLKATAILSIDEIREKGPAAANEAVRKLADDLTRGMVQRVFDELERATEATGNTVDAKGAPFSPSMYLEMLRKIQLTFDSDGNWLPPQAAASPRQKEIMESVLAQAESDPSFLAEREAIISKQRGEWRAREADRRLVD